MYRTNAIQNIDVSSTAVILLLAKSH